MTERNHEGCNRHEYEDEVKHFKHLARRLINKTTTHLHSEVQGVNVNIVRF